MNTPRTDALLNISSIANRPPIESRYTQMCAHARQLETEVQELRAALEDCALWLHDAQPDTAAGELAETIFAALAKVPK